MIKKFLITLLSTTLLLAACAPAVITPEEMMENPTEVMTEKIEDDMMEESTDDMMEDSTDDMMEESTDEMMDESTDEMMEETAWFRTTFTNVSTGEAFTINDFKGKVVLVENLAMWCSNCKKQQEQVKLLHELLGMNENLISIGLDIDTNEKASDLKTYVENNGFNWIYAVASEEVTREIANLYGAQFLNPPSTPILIIDRKGQAHPMPFGIKSAEEL
ncbi:MAG: redoxin domain-containing protein, partial [Anaerolineaceae bacterium]|nr:redoxin domain-containing protein [Anaerolineaceae bacterium]